MPKIPPLDTKTLTICFFKLIFRILFQFLTVSLGADASSDNNPQSVVGFRVAAWFKTRQFNKMMIPTGQRVLVVSVPIKQLVMSEIIREQQGDNTERIDESQTLI